MRQLTFEESRNILRKNNVNLFNSKIVKSKEQIIELAKRINFPVVIKAYSTEIIHKNAEGFIKTNILNEKELIKSYIKIIKRLDKIQLRNYTIIVQKELRGNEFIIGAKFDETFGYSVIFGLGGIYTEVLGKVSMRIGEVSPKIANEMIEEAAGKILQDKKTNKRIVNLIVKVSRLAKAEKIIEMDLNPLIVNSDGISVVDVRIIK